MPSGSLSGSFSSNSSSSSHVLNNTNSTNKSSEGSKSIAVINANARSLGPKIESLADCIHEDDADIAIVSETWFQDDGVAATAVDVAGEHGLDLFTLNRQVVAANGRQYGGVAVTTRACRSTFKKVNMANPDNFKVFYLEGKIKGIGEKIIVVAVYIPPNYPGHRATSCLDYIADVISEAKRRFSSSMITVAGNWNQWPVDHILQEHTDLTEVAHGPTRNGRRIDKFLVNLVGLLLNLTPCPRKIMALVGKVTTWSHSLELRYQEQNYLWLNTSIGISQIKGPADFNSGWKIMTLERFMAKLS